MHTVVLWSPLPCGKTDNGQFVTHCRSMRLERNGGITLKPLIALTASLDDSGKSYHIYRTYMESVARAGGIPVMLGMTQEKEDIRRLISAFDGFLFVGGEDVMPAYYGQETMLSCGEVLPMRDEAEIALYRAVIETDKPIFGICRGIQLMNVAAGGTLYQDIPSQVKAEVPLQHSQCTPSHIATQKITVVPNTLLSDILGGKGTIFMNSHHHQAVRDIAPGYRRCAFTSDGVTEGIYMPEKRFVLGVQWHPERLSAEFEDAAALFRAFVAASVPEA